MTSTWVCDQFMGWTTKGRDMKKRNMKLPLRLGHGNGRGVEKWHKNVNTLSHEMEVCGEKWKVSQDSSLMQLFELKKLASSSILKKIENQ